MPKSITVIDDDELVLESVRRMLRNVDCQLQCISDAEQAFSYLQSHSSDILIVDQRMPRIDGIDLLEQLHAACVLSDACFYLCSSSTPPTDICSRLEAIGGSVLPKAALSDREKLAELCSAGMRNNNSLASAD